jgi:hypothetical protein
MNKLIRVFSYTLMILGALIILGGLTTGILMLVSRGAHMMEQSWPMMRMMGSGSVVTTRLNVMLQGLLVSGFGMLLYLAGEIAKPKDPSVAVTLERTTRVKKTTGSSKR